MPQEQITAAMMIEEKARRLNRETIFFVAR